VTRALVWGFAGLGILVSGLAFAILAVGLVEGWHVMPDPLSELLAVAIAATATWTAGVFCERAPGRWAAAAVAVVPVAVLVAGYVLMEKTAGHGMGLAPRVVAEAVALSAALVGGAAYVARRSAPDVADSAPAQSRITGLISTLTGVAAAFGLSASGMLVGAFLAVWLDEHDVLPEGSAPWAWVVFAAVGTVAAGATVADVARRSATLSIAIAGALMFGCLWEVDQSVETTGAEGVEVPLVVLFAVAFTGLLGAGAWLRRRRASSSRPSAFPRSPQPVSRKLPVRRWRVGLEQEDA
jgi:F0F1-type ATP synthase assembly protein I